MRFRTGLRQRAHRFSLIMACLGTDSSPRVSHPTVGPPHTRYRRRLWWSKRDIRRIQVVVKQGRLVTLPGHADQILAEFRLTHLNQHRLLCLDHLLD